MAAKPRGLRIFRGAEAPDLVDTEVMGRPVMDSVPDRDVLAAVGAPGGYANKVLFGDPEQGGMSLLWLWYAPSYALPRHRHDVDCLYYVLAGEAHLGNQVLKAGDGFFVPAGAPYSYRAGPDGVQVLEFRAVSRFGIHVTESPERWAQLAEVARANKDRWEALSAPTP
jgi:hypothetical protein